jgi:hypothetical protein
MDKIDPQPLLITEAYDEQCVTGEIECREAIVGTVKL